MGKDFGLSLSLNKVTSGEKMINQAAINMGGKKEMFCNV